MPAKRTMNRNVKVLRVITRLNVGGPAIHALLLTREMGRLGYQTLLVAGACEAGEGDMSYAVQPSDPIVWLPDLSRSVSPLRNLRAVARLWLLMRRERPDIVHTHTAMAGFAGRAAGWLAGVPVIVHTFHGNSLRHYFSPLASRLFAAIERLLARASSRICTISAQQLHELAGELQIAPAGKFRLVPLGLPLDSFLELEPPSPPSGVLRVGWLGRLVAVKDVPLLVDVITRTCGQSDGIEFLVAGDGPDRELLERAAAIMPDRVRYLGWQADVRSVIERADVLLQTSRNEGTPVALIQGMAAARPFVSTPAGGVVDMVAGAGARTTEGALWHCNAVLVDGGADAFAKALIRLSCSTDELRKMAAEAREFASRRYRKERLVDDLDALYREALGMAKRLNDL